MWNRLRIFDIVLLFQVVDLNWNCHRTINSDTAHEIINFIIVIIHKNSKCNRQDNLFNVVNEGFT